MRVGDQWTNSSNRVEKTTAVAASGAHHPLGRLGQADFTGLTGVRSRPSELGGEQRVAAGPVDDRVELGVAQRMVAGRGSGEPADVVVGQRLQRDRFRP